MCDRYASVECSQRCCHRRRGITLHQHPLRPAIAEQWVKPLEHASHNLRERLFWAHYVEVEVRDNPELSKHLVKHSPMLRADAHNRFEGIHAILEFGNDRR